MKLPDNVIEALVKGRKIDAIKLLRKEWNIGLKEAKELVEACPVDLQSPGQGVNQGDGDRARFRARNAIIAIAVVVSFVWALVNIVNVVASIIVLINQDGYKKTTFTVEKLHHTDDEAGLSWGFTGRLPDRNGRLYAPSLADAKSLEYQGLRKMFPPGTKIDVWHNPQVTDTLFQHRTLRLIPYTPDLAATETERILWWATYCLLPFAVVLVLAGSLKRRDESNTIPFHRRKF